jgi:hypothetical protein
MKHLLDSFWRAAAYCLHPRVIVLSVLPLLIAGGLTWLLGWLYWERAIDAVQGALQAWSLTDALHRWLSAVGLGGLYAAFAPLIVVALTVPVVVVLSLLLVAMLMTPSLSRLVAARRFPAMERRRGGSWWGSLFWSLGCTIAALVALMLSIPLWFVPPLVMVVPPLIWGWLTYKVMTYDALADHASADERRRILHEQRWPLLAIGVIAGYLGAAPAMMWSMGVMALAWAPVLIPASVWLYTLIFAFSALWFAHFALGALHRLRLDEAGPVDLPEPAVADEVRAFDVPLPPPPL